jgi:hypothetical protein
MPRGGYRDGAGRKPGSQNLNIGKTREIIERAAEQGLLPLEVMLDNMRLYHRKAEEALRKLLAGKMSDHELPAKADEDQPIATEDDPAGEDAGAYGGIIEGLKRVLELRKLAGDEAARAAPYVHPRQGYVGVERTPSDEEIPLAERLAYYQRRDDLKAAGDKVVELKPQGGQGACPSGSEPIPPPIN